MHDDRDDRDDSDDRDSNGSGASGGWRRPVAAAERQRLRRTLPGGGGLCAGCRHLRLLDSASSLFVRCALAERDPAYPRYPMLPVLACAGHEPWRPT